MTGSHDAPLVAVSLLVAILASYSALDLSGRVAAARGGARRAWLLCGSVAMGVGIWSMHFIGMLSFHLPIAIRYNVPIWLFSVAIAVTASFLALVVVSRPEVDSAALATAAPLMGLAIAGMHYTGMAAMRVPAHVRYHTLLVALSVVIAIVASFVALWLALHFREASGWRSAVGKATSAVVMGIAICGMHYTGMAAVSFDPGGANRLESGAELVATRGLAITVTLTSFAILGLAMVSVSIDRRVQRKLARSAATAQAVLQAEIGERKQAELERAAAEAHYRRLVESSPYGILVCDPDGRLLEVNPAAEQILSGAEVVGRPFAELVEPDDRGRLQRAIAELQGGARETVELELRVRRASGENRLLALTLTEVRETEHRPSIQGIARDITAERQQQQQLRRAERLASVGTLIGGVAHELNNPLTAIKSFAELMLLDERTPEDADALETMRREAHRAARIVSDLRLVARATQDDEGQTREVVDLNDVVRHVLKLRRYVLETHNVHIDEQLDPAGPRVLGDRGQLEQVVLNLVVNAGQAMESCSGERRLRVHTRVVAGQALLEVGDTGTGIAPANLERIFDPFWTTKNAGEGTGLGLSLVHSIVSDHDGTIAVRSDLGRGTVFRIHLPKARQPAAAAKLPGAGIAAAARPLRVLVVDDELSIRRALHLYLSRRGHEVETAGDGAEALAILDALGPADAGYDVILSDLRMPGIGGDRFLDELRARGTGLDRRVIFISGDGVNQNGARTLEAAAVPVIYKPFELGDLARALEAFAEGARTSAPPALPPNRWRATAG